MQKKKKKKNLTRQVTRLTKKKEKQRRKIEWGKENSDNHQHFLYKTGEEKSRKLTFKVRCLKMLHRIQI